MLKDEVHILTIVDSVQNLSNHARLPLPVDTMHNPSHVLAALPVAFNQSQSTIKLHMLLPVPGRQDLATLYKPHGVAMVMVLISERDLRHESGVG